MTTTLVPRPNTSSQPAQTQENKPKKILLVGDYGHQNGLANDLAFMEVKQKLYDLARQKNIHITIDTVSADAFDTAQTAALVAQGTASGEYDLVYHNCAPRKDRAKARNNNEGEGLAWTYVRTPPPEDKEVQVIGVNSGDQETVNTFSLLNREGEIREVDSDVKGSQFRSRDIFPEHVIAALNETIEIKPDSALNVPVRDELPPGVVTAAEIEAAKRLKALKESNNVKYGWAAEEYVTVIAPGAQVKNLMETASGDHPFAEVDALFVKTETGDKALEAGFAAAHLALHSENANGRIIYAFSGEDKGRFEARLDNGATIQTDDLRVLAFMKGHVQRVTDASTGTEPTDWKRRKELPEEWTVAYVDGYGNMKLGDSHENIMRTICEREGISEEIAGSRITLMLNINGREKDIVLATGGSFSVRDGEFALSAGSSTPTGEEASAELFLRGGNAAEKLGMGYGKNVRLPQPGDTVSIRFKAIEKVEPGTAIDLGNVRITTDRSAKKGI